MCGVHSCSSCGEEAARGAADSCRSIARHDGARKNEETCICVLNQLKNQPPYKVHHSNPAQYIRILGLGSDLEESLNVLSSIRSHYNVLKGLKNITS